MNATDADGAMLAAEVLAAAALLVAVELGETVAGFGGVTDAVEVVGRLEVPVLEEPATGVTVLPPAAVLLEALPPQLGALAVHAWEEAPVHAAPPFCGVGAEHVRI